MTPNLVTISQLGWSLSKHCIGFVTYVSSLTYRKIAYVDFKKEKAAQFCIYLENFFDIVSSS